MPVFLVINGKLEIAVANVEVATLASPIRWVKGTKEWVSPNVIIMFCTAYRKARRSERPQCSRGALDEVCLHSHCRKCFDSLFHDVD